MSERQQITQTFRQRWGGRDEGVRGREGGGRGKRYPNGLTGHRSVEGDS